MYNLVMAVSINEGICFRIEPEVKCKKIRFFKVVSEHKAIKTTEAGIEEVDLIETAYSDILKVLPIIFLILIDQVMFANLYTIGFMVWNIANFICRSLRQKGEKWQEYHAVEHKIVNAYQKYQRIPTVEEVKRESRFHSDCGTNKVLETSIYCLLTSCFLWWYNRELWHIQSGALSYIVEKYICIYVEVICIYVLCIKLKLAQILITKFEKLNFFQYFTTIEPEETQLEMEIEIGLKGLVKWEQHQASENPE